MLEGSQFVKWFDQLMVMTGGLNYQQMFGEELDDDDEVAIGLNYEVGMENYCDVELKRVFDKCFEGFEIVIEQMSPYVDTTYHCLMNGNVISMGTALTSEHAKLSTMRNAMLHLSDAHIVNVVRSLKGDLVKIEDSKVEEIESKSVDVKVAMGICRKREKFEKDFEMEFKTNYHMVIKHLLEFNLGITSVKYFQDGRDIGCVIDGTIVASGDDVAYYCHEASIEKYLLLFGHMSPFEDVTYKGVYTEFCNICKFYKFKGLDHRCVDFNYVLKRTFPYGAEFYSSLMNLRVEILGIVNRVIGGNKTGIGNDTIVNMVDYYYNSKAFLGFLLKSYYGDRVISDEFAGHEAVVRVFMRPKFRAYFRFYVAYHCFMVMCKLGYLCKVPLC